MQKIILDTNFLVYLIEFKINLFQELDRTTSSGYKVYILDSTITELEKLAKKNIYAKIALKLTDKFEIIKVDADKLVDDVLVELQDENTIIGTQDKELKSRLKHHKLIIRQKKYLEII